MVLLYWPKVWKQSKTLLRGYWQLYIYIKNEDFFEDICNDAEKWFDTSNYEKNDERPLPIGKNKKVPGLFKDELGGKIITEVDALRPKAYSHLDDDDNEHRCIKVCHKQKLMFQNFKDWLFCNKTIYRL